jgi:Multicopper oxidase
LEFFVEIVFILAPAINTINHPFHLHGYQMFMMGMGQNPDALPMTVAKAKALHKKKKKAPRSAIRRYPIKDTISIPSKGYAVFRFKADNPGWWLLHCHFGKFRNHTACYVANLFLSPFAEWHMNVGMALVLQVGEPTDMVPPPCDFPKCNSFTPFII